MNFVQKKYKWNMMFIYSLKRLSKDRKIDYGKKGFYHRL